MKNHYYQLILDVLFSKPIELRDAHSLLKHIGEQAVNELVSKGEIHFRVKKYETPPSKPDPIALGQELADYIKSKWELINANISFDIQKLLGLSDGHGIGIDYNSHVAQSLELKWECDFWRAKTWGEKLP